MRTLLTNRSQSFSQSELVHRTQNSQGLVSRILASLVRQRFVEEAPRPAMGKKGEITYQVTDFDGLLDAWKSEDNWKKRGTIYQFSCLENNPQQCAKLIQTVCSGTPVFFTQWFAAWLRRPYTTPPIISAYVETIPLELPEKAFVRRVSSGGQIWLIVPGDQGLFFENRQVGEFTLVSDVQIYLDLLQVGLRGEEQAVELRKWDGFSQPNQ